MAERPGQKIIRRVAAVLVVLMGIGLMQDRARLLLDGRASLEWPAVSGSVLEAAAEPVSGARIGPGWRLRVRYDYEVDGQRYSSDRVRLSRRLGGQTEVQAREQLLLYQAGDSIPVHYDPVRPSRSVLVPGPDGRAWFGLMVGLGLIAIAVTFWTVPTRTVARPSRRRKKGG